MIDQTDERVIEFDECGFATAWLYDPQSVGGRHVTSVPKDAKKQRNMPLPLDRTVSPSMSLGKGSTTPLTSFALGGFRHDIMAGPKDEPVDDDDMDPREDDPDKLHHPHREGHTDIRGVGRGA